MTSRVHTTVRPVRTAAVAVACAVLALTAGGPSGADTAGAATVRAASVPLPAAPGAVTNGLIWD
ncbi:hypothetical protein [Streptomyces sp. NBC_00207]|uniref:hypothetical protein n=1 Tax=unclassified Streptomyces TaxID=2593676 RepID=UPI00288476E6|nr:hypothetical protein [Streptomyces sp. DSM 41633]